MEAFGILFLSIFLSFAMMTTLPPERIHPFLCSQDICNLNGKYQYCDKVNSLCVNCDSVRNSCHGQPPPDCYQYCYELLRTQVQEQQRGLECSSLLNISHGAHNGSTTGTSKQGTRVVSHCNAGYQLLGAELAVCGRFGQWSNALPLCIGTHCGRPPHILHGRSTTNIAWYRPGTVVQYTCNDGYKQAGNNSQCECQADGRWHCSMVPLCISSQIDSTNQNTEVVIALSVTQGISIATISICIVVLCRKVRNEKRPQIPSELKPSSRNGKCDGDFIVVQDRSMDGILDTTEKSETSLKCDCKCSVTSDDYKKEVSCALCSRQNGLSCGRDDTLTAGMEDTSEKKTLLPHNLLSPNSRMTESPTQNSESSGLGSGTFSEDEAENHNVNGHQGRSPVVRVHINVQNMNADINNLSRTEDVSMDNNYDIGSFNDTDSQHWRDRSSANSSDDVQHSRNERYPEVRHNNPPVPGSPSGRQLYPMLPTEENSRQGYHDILLPACSSEESVTEPKLNADRTLTQATSPTDDSGGHQIMFAVNRREINANDLNYY